MRIEPQRIADVLLITPPKFGDNRGFFSETWSAPKLAAQGFGENFVQDNHSLSAQVGTVRGLHCQMAPSVQGKLVRVIRGAIWDVAVDIRRGSATYGQYVAAELSAENWQQLWFCTILPDTEVIYKVTADYDRGAERGVIWNDPDLALPWPVAPDAAVLSDKDRILPKLSECESWFSL
jgi:dTDP-4-dehydrorhamnose 3,5-epimerase